MSGQRGFLIYMLIICVVGGFGSIIIIKSLNRLETRLQDEAEIDAYNYDQVEEWLVNLRDRFHDDRLSNFVDTCLEDDKITQDEFALIEEKHSTLSNTLRVAKIKAMKDVPEIDPEITDSWDDKQVDYFEYDRIKRWVEELNEEGVSGLNELVKTCTQDGIVTQTEFKIIEDRYTQLSASKHIADIREAIGVKDDPSSEEKHGTDHPRWDDSLFGKPSTSGNTSE